MGAQGYNMTFHMKSRYVNRICVFWEDVLSLHIPTITCGKVVCLVVLEAFTSKLFYLDYMLVTRYEGDSWSKIGYVTSLFS